MRREEGARDPEADAENAHPERLGLGGVGGGVGGVHGELRDSVTVGFQRRPFWQSKVSAVNVFAVQEERWPHTKRECAAVKTSLCLSLSLLSTPRK